MSGPVQLAEFFSFLRASGEAVVIRDELIESSEDPAEWQAAFLEDCENLPGLDRAPLPWHPETARTATAFFYRLSQALANRALDEKQVQAICAGAPPPLVSPGEILSADLTLRYLPELHSMAEAISQDDPLVEGLEAMASRFPLSSVGIPIKSPPNLSPLRSHEGLWLLYIDRVIERQDLSRLADPGVRLAVMDALGESGQSLAPRIAAQLALDSQPSLAESSDPPNHEPT
jgi:hypothetical protein